MLQIATQRGDYYYLTSLPFAQPATFDDMMNIAARQDEKGPANANIGNCSAKSEELLNCAKISWQVDSGASRHGTPFRSIFTSYTPIGSRPLTVQVATGDIVKVLGRGDVCIRTSRGVDMMLIDVWHSPELHGNLMSVAALDEQGYSNIFVGGKYTLARGSLIVAEAQKFENKYFLDGTLSTHDNLSELWHKRLAHLNSSGVQKLIERSLLPGLQGSTTDRCAYCPIGEQPCAKSEFLKLVHMSLRGPLKKPSLNKSLYFVTFIDDYSRKTWCFALKRKSQILNAFKEFRSYAEGHTGKKLNCLFSDQGEVYSYALEAYCRKHKIMYLSMPLGAPCVNNLAETVSNNLLTTVFSLLAKAKLPWSYWDMALSTAVHVLNLCPAASLKNDIPDRVWFGHEVTSYDYLRVFGCKALIRVAPDDRSKGDETRECIFVGYDENGEVYKFYDPCQMVVICSKDAEFFEDQTLCDINRGDQKEQQGGDINRGEKEQQGGNTTKRGVFEYLGKFIHQTTFRNKVNP